MRINLLLLVCIFTNITHTAFAQSEIIGIQVIDGDTVEVKYPNKTKEVLRLSFIDAPEAIQSNGYRAARNLHKIIQGNESNISLKINGSDFYGRKHATLYNRSDDINLQQVADGYAWVANENAPKKFAEVERQAFKYKKGLWNERSPISPWQFRNNLK